MKKTVKAWACMNKYGEIKGVEHLHIYKSEVYGGMEPCLITYDDGKKGGKR